MQNISLLAVFNVVSFSHILKIKIIIFLEPKGRGYILVMYFTNKELEFTLVNIIIIGIYSFPIHNILNTHTHTYLHTRKDLKNQNRHMISLICYKELNKKLPAVQYTKFNCYRY